MKAIILAAVLLPLTVLSADDAKLKKSAEITKLKSQIHELTNGIPTMYVMNSNETNNQMGIRIQEIWKHYDVAVSNLNKLKIEFKKM